MPKATGPENCTNCRYFIDKSYPIDDPDAPQVNGVCHTPTRNEHFPEQAQSGRRRVNETTWCPRYEAL